VHQEPTPVQPQGNAPGTFAPAPQVEPQAPTQVQAGAEDDKVQVTSSVSPRHKLESWIAEMVRSNASDLILRAGGRPSCRIDGRIHFLPGRVPNAGPLLEVLTGVIGEDRVNKWKEHGSVDAALHLDGVGRFRLNAYKQMG
jgi:hypothetical protein